MDARIDPGCGAAHQMLRKQAQQSMLLVGDAGGQLASVVKTTQEKEVRDHLVACARCRHYDPACVECGFHSGERHGWRCSKQASTWQDWFPWNWRARHAPPKPRGWDGEVAPDGTRTIPARPVPAPAPTPEEVSAEEEPAEDEPVPAAPLRAAPPPRPPSRVAAPPTRSAPVREARPPVAPTPRAIPARPAAPPPAPRKPPRPPAAKKPTPSPIAAAYSVLGLTSAATQDEVRSAFRERAKEYHPDKVAHMAPEFREVGERKMKEINEAYDRIRKSWPPAK